MPALYKLLHLLSIISIATIVCCRAVIAADTAKDLLCVSPSNFDYYLIPRITVTNSAGSTQFGAGLGAHCPLVPDSLHHSWGPIIGTSDFLNHYFAGVSTYGGYIATLTAHLVSEFRDDKVSGFNVGLGIGVVAMLYTEIGYDFLEKYTIVRFGAIIEFPMGYK